MGLPKVNTVLLDEDLANARYITNELLPCPFCGNTKILTAATKNERTGNIVYKAWCSTLSFDCTASLSVCLGGEDKIKESRAEVVKRWNARVNLIYKH